jgi:hypothetical protein
MNDDDLKVWTLTELHNLVEQRLRMRREARAARMSYGVYGLSSGPVKAPTRDEYAAYRARLSYGVCRPGS